MIKIERVSSNRCRVTRDFPLDTRPSTLVSFRISIFGFRIFIWVWRPVTAVLLTFSLAVGIAARAHGQTNPPNSPSTVRCPTAADPHKLYLECRGQLFDSIEETLTQDWAGFRTELNKLGISPTVSYTADLMGNVTGGQSRGFTYAGTLQAAIFWDLGKLIRLPGLAFNIGAAWSTGKNLSANYIGNSFTIQNAYGSPDNGTNNLMLGEVYLQQQLFNNSLMITAGRLAPSSSFATMPVLGNYVNGGINANPGALGINDVTFASHPPAVQWGAQAIFNITPAVQAAVGVFNNNPNSAGGAKGGLDFTFQEGNRGVFSVVQVNYLFNHAEGDTGLPGQYTLGGSYNSNRFSSLRNENASESGTYNVYGLFQQMIYRDGDTSSQKGLTVWGETVLAPKSSVNTMPYFVGGGLSYQGLIPQRENDFVSAGLIYGSFSRFIPHTTAETVIEVNYQITLKRWLSIMPDMQYVIRPSGNSAIRNAFVLGTEVTISF
jgi:porin